jgi:hypothetical protein
MSDERNILEMSDEELLALDPSTFAQAGESPEPTEQDPAQADPESNADESTGEESEADSGEGSQGQSAESDATTTTGEEDSATQGEEEGSTDEKAKGSEESNPKPKSVEPPAESPIDYEAAYKQLTAPFKANGREIQVNSVEDAVALMQMGANYNKKMAALKPNLKLMKLLENNGLLSEEKLNFLIDLEKKNPDAINKLIKDSGVDPLDLDASKAGEYKPTPHKVDDRELELDAVLDEIQDTDSYSRTIDVVSNQWDSASKNVIANSPQVLKVINAHVQSGVFDVIVKEVEREKMFGRLSGLSDIEAYRQVGDAIQSRGGFDHLNTQGQRTQPKPVVVQPKPKMGDEGKRREKKLAASSSQPAAPSKAPADFNPLALSDDEFSKVVNQRFL